jgi:ABC-type transporter Mla subunit MlaD
MTRRKMSPRTVGLVTIVLSIVVGYVIFSGLFRKPFAPASQTVTAVFQRAAQLHPGDQVRLQGNADGSVKSVEPISTSGDAVRVVMNLNRSAGPIYADARASLSFQTLLGGVFYVALDRGSPQAGLLGSGDIPLSRTTVQVELEDITGIFRGGAVSGLKILPGQLATSLSNPGAIASDLGTLNRVAPDATTALSALRGENPGSDLPQVINAAANTVKALDANESDLRTLVAGAATTVGITGSRSASIQRAIGDGPSVTNELTVTLRQLGTTLDLAHGLVLRLMPAAPQVSPTLSQLRPTLVSAGVLLQHAKLLTQALTPTLTTLSTASKTLIPLIDNVTPSLDRVNSTILPYLAKKDPGTGYSTTVMIGGFAAGFGGSSASEDQNGHYIRFPASVGLSSLYLPCTSSLVDPTAGALLKCDSFNTALGQYLSYLPQTASLGAAVANASSAP